MARLRLDQLGQTGGDRALDAAMILATQNAEESLVAPVVVPRVCNQPVGHLLLAPHAPAQDADGMTAQFLAMLVLVHTALVKDQILVDREGPLHGSVRHDLLLDVADIASHRVGLGAEVLVLGVLHIVAGLALVLAFGRLAVVVAGGTGAVHMVLAGRNLVRAATLLNEI